MSRFEPDELELELEALYGMAGAHRRSPAWRAERWRLLFYLAQLQDGVADTIRAKAVYTLYRLGLRQRRAGAVHWRIADLLAGLEARIASKPDPVAARRALMRRERRRGPQVKNAERDFDLAVAVVRRTSQGQTFQEAVEENARVEGLHRSRVEKIVKKTRAKYSRLGIRVEAIFLQEQAGEWTPDKDPS